MPETVTIEQYNDLADKYNSLMTKAVKLAADVKELETAVSLKKADLRKMKAEHKATIKELDEKEDEIITKVDKLEKDQKELAKQEKDLLASMNKLEKTRLELDKKQKELFNRETDVIAKAKELDLREKEVAKRETATSQFRAIKDDVDNLKEQKDTLSKDVQSLSKQKDMLMSRVADMEQILHKEAELKEYENQIAEKEARLERFRTDLISEKSKIEDHLFQDYLSHESNMVPMADLKTLQVPELKGSVKSFSIYDLIKKGHELVRAKRIEEAKAVYYNIGEEYEKLQVSDEEKRKIYYFVLDLKNEIELMDLS